MTSVLLALVVVALVAVLVPSGQDRRQPPTGGSRSPAPERVRAVRRAARGWGDGLRASGARGSVRTHQPVPGRPPAEVLRRQRRDLVALAAAVGVCLLLALVGAPLWLPLLPAAALGLSVARLRRRALARQGARRRSEWREARLGLSRDVVTAVVERTERTGGAARVGGASSDGRDGERPARVVATLPLEIIEHEAAQARALPPGTHEVAEDGSWQSGAVPDSSWARRQAAEVAPVPQVRGLSGRRAVIEQELARLEAERHEAELAEVVELRTQTLLSWRRPQRDDEAPVQQAVGS